MKKVKIHFILLILITLSLVACNSTLKVERRGGYILVKNNIKNKNPYLPYDELEGFIDQGSMNGRLAPYFRPGVYFYEKSLLGEETKFKLFLRKSLGTKPVILDTMYVLSSVDKLQIYLKNKGFYHSSVEKSIKYKRKTASVTYTINSGPPCIVRKFNYFISDTAMNRYIMADTANGKLRSGMIYDTYVLDDDRDRIASNLRNNSYFNFSLSDIYYVVDTSNAGLTADVELYVRKIRVNIPGTTDSVTETTHPRYYIRNIYINSETDPLSPAKVYDTVVYKYFLNKSDTSARSIYVLYNRKLTLKPTFLASSLNFAQGDAYSQASVNQTYKKLISQPIIGSANINMATLEPGSVDSSDRQWLDCNIRMTRNQLNTFNIGTEGTNSGGRFGLGINTSIQNRNLFKGAEVLSLKIRASAEIQGSLNNEDVSNYFLFFSTLEGGAEASIDFPRLLIPYRSKYQQDEKRGRTSLTAGAGFELRPEYKRTISSASWSYKWNRNEKISHILTPLELNFIDIFPSESFQAALDSLTDPVYKSQYTDHLLTMIRYSIIMSNIGITKLNDQYFLRLNTETSGNIPFLIDNASDRPVNEDGHYEHFGVQYSQFVRFDVDYRKYWKLRFNNTLAFRVMGGIAKPYGNSESVPFEKSFWLGGANDMRGWRLRSLGPGAYVNSNNVYDKTGEIMLLSTLEHRFPIYSFVLGSLFVDAGNVWLRQASEDFPKGEFNFDTFYKQIAIDAGLGLRFDFSFFILRLDVAVPIHNPARETDAWFNPADVGFRNAIWNFGIGYPF